MDVPNINKFKTVCWLLSYLHRNEEVNVSKWIITHFLDALKKTEKTAYFNPLKFKITTIMVWLMILQLLTRSFGLHNCSTISSLKSLIFKFSSSYFFLDLKQKTPYKLNPSRMKKGMTLCNVFVTHIGDLTSGWVEREPTVLQLKYLLYVGRN